MKSSSPGRVGPRLFAAGAGVAATPTKA